MEKIKININGVVKEGLGVDVKLLKTKELDFGRNKLLTSNQILSDKNLLRYYLSRIQSSSVILTPSINVSNEYNELINEFSVTLPKIYPINNELYMYIDLFGGSPDYKAIVGFNLTKAEYPKTTKMVILDNGDILPINNLDTILNVQFKAFLRRKNVNSEVDFKIMAHISCDVADATTIPFIIKDYVINELGLKDYRDYIKTVYNSFIMEKSSIDGSISGYIGEGDNRLNITINERSTNYFISITGIQYDSYKEFKTMDELLKFFGKVIDKYVIILNGIDEFSKFIY